MPYNRYNFASPGAAAVDELTRFMAEREAQKRQAMLDQIMQRRESRNDEIQRANLDSITAQRGAMEDERRQRMAVGTANLLSPTQDLDPDTAERLKAGGLGVLIRRAGPASNGETDGTVNTTDVFRGTPQQLKAQEEEKRQRTYLSSLDPNSPEARALNYETMTGKNAPAGIFDKKETPRTGIIGEYEYARDQGYGGTFEQYQNEDANRRRPVTNMFSGGDPQQGGAATPLDPESQDLMSQAGLTYNGFLALTGKMSQLPRDKETRNRASAEVAAWARKRGMDVSTLSSQYKAYNEALESNIQRYNRTLLAEGEIKADVENLLTSVKESGLGDVRAINAAKQWLKGELNDPNAAQYAFFLNQLTNDIALYNAASQGRATLQADLEDAKSVVQRGVAAGSLTGMQKAIMQSVEKMGTVLEGAVNRSRKNVWDLFGVGDKYKPTTAPTTAPPSAPGVRKMIRDANGRLVFAP